MYIWVLFTLFSGLSSIGFNYINRYILRNGDDSTSYAWWFEFFRTIIYLPFCFIFLDSPMDFISVFPLIALGVTEFFGIYVYMKMHANSDLSISTIVSQLRLVWVPLIAYLFLGERLIIKEYIGIGLILLGQIVVAIKGKIYLDKGIKFALISSVFVSLGNIFAKSASSNYASPIIVLAMGMPTIFGFPFLMKNGMVRIKNLGKIRWKKILLATVFNAVTMLFLVKALKFGEVSKVIGFFQSISVLGVITGILFLGENQNIKRKMVGGILVVLGIILLV